MSQETATDIETSTESRSLLDKIRSSPFLSDLFTNRLALFGIGIVGVIVVVALYSRFFMSEAVISAGKLSARPDDQFLAPSLQYPFGTDLQSRDIFKRVLYGAWYAMKFGTITVGLSTLLGVSLGTLAAYYSDFVDNVIMRTMDVLLSFPSLLLALALVAVLPENWGLWRATIALILVYTPRFARVVRGAALKVLEDEYIEATIAIGAKDPRVLIRHITPNTLAPITVQSTLNFGLAIIDLAALSFLGFGAEPGTPTWGMMLSQGVDKGLLSGFWWWSFFPGLFLALTVLGFNLLGDGMRDALDPRMREAVD
ncbi:MAG: peptide/nickel transport system permease protein [Halobacteriales archaeon]|jgi:peptide/nickel transport system permease protein